MKKIKLLMPLLGVAATAGAVLPAAVSCGNGQAETADVKITEPTNKKAIVKTIGDETAGYQTEITIAGFSIEGVGSLDDLTLNVETDAFQKEEFDVTTKLVPEETPTNGDAIKFSIVITVDDNNYFLPDLYQLFMTITNKDGKILWASADYYVNIETKIEVPAERVGKFSTDHYNYEGFIISHFDWDILDNYVPILIAEDKVEGWDQSTDNWLNLTADAEMAATFERNGTSDTATLAVYDDRETQTNINFHLAIVSLIFNPLTLDFEVDGTVLEPNANIKYTLTVAP